MLESGVFLSHINLCVTDMDRSLEFYKTLGFRVLDDFVMEEPLVGSALGIELRRFRAAFLTLGEGGRDPWLDVVQFLDPPTGGSPYSSLNNVGICRFALHVPDLDAAVAYVREALDPPEVAPATWVGEGEERLGIYCFYDPDGIVVQLVSGLRTE